MNVDGAEVKLDMNKIALASKFVFIGSMFKIAAKMAAEFTPEEIEQSPYYVEHVLPKLEDEANAWLDWCDRVKGDLLQEVVTK